MGTLGSPHPQVCFHVVLGGTYGFVIFYLKCFVQTPALLEDGNLFPPQTGGPPVVRVLEMELLLPTPPPPQGADMLPTPPPPAPTSLPLLFCLLSKASGLLLPSVGRALGMWQF